ncbi:MAG: gluconate kinase, partial [Rodentibacter sp.]
MSENEQQGKSFILMGVSSTGKTSVGTEVAHRLGIKLID